MNARAASLLRGRGLALAVFAVVLVWRLCVLWRFLHSPYSLPVTGDMKFYAESAQRIAAGQWTDFHAFYGEPLYAYLLAAVYALGGAPTVWFGLLQAISDAATAVLIFEIAQTVFDQSRRRAVPIGLLAALGWMLFVPAAAYCPLLVPTSLIVALSWFCICWLLRRSSGAPRREWFLMALIIGVTAMLSAAALLLLPLFLFAAFQRNVRAVLPICAGLLLGTAPAWGHNLFLAHDPVFLSAHGGLNFWIGNNPEANGYPKIPAELPSDQARLLQRSVEIAETNAGHPLPRSAVSQFWSNKARHYVATNAVAWLRLLAIKARNFWSSFQYDDLSTITALRDAAIILPGLGFGLVAALGLPGAVLALGNKNARWIIAAVLLQMIVLLGVFVNERYRLPAVPGLLLLAAFFLVETQGRLAAAEWRRVAFTGIALAASVLFVFHQPNDPALRSIDDYKAARRELSANDFPHAENRFRLAFGQLLANSEVAPAVARALHDAGIEEAERDGRPPR